MAQANATPTPFSKFFDTIFTKKEFEDKANIGTFHEKKGALLELESFC
jgi:hypothetical protein